MKKIAMILSALLLVVCVPVTSFAEDVSPYFLTSGYLSMDGNTAICTAYLQAETTNTYVTMKLWHKNSCIKTWTEQGKKTIAMNERVSVKKGELYKLTIDMTIDGVQQPRIEQSKRC